MEEKAKSPIKESQALQDLPKLLTHLKNLITAQNLAEVKASLDILSFEWRRDVIHSKELGQCLFFHACIVKAMDIIKYFISDCMANVNEVGNVTSLGKENLTPLFISVRWCNIDLIHLLVENGADLHWKDLEDRTAIIYACYLHRMEAAYTLKEYGADINTKKNQELCVQDVSYLNRALKLGFNVDYLDDRGQSCFMEAVKNGNLDVIKVLLKVKCNISRRGYIYGCNALDLAIRTNQHDIYNYFINNSVYSLPELLLSYEFCGALEILIVRNLEKGAGLWNLSLETRKNRKTIEVPFKYSRALDHFSDIGSAEFHTESICLARWSFCALKIVCRILNLHHPFVKIAFNTVAYCPKYGSENYLSFEKVRELCKFNSTSDKIHTNGVYLAMTGVSYLCKNQFKKCKQYPETIVPFIEKIAELVTDVINPGVDKKLGSTYLFHVYQHMLLMIVHLIEYALETECPGKNMLSTVISKAAKMKLSLWPSSLLLIAVERGFSLKTIVCLIIAGSDINAQDSNHNNALHLLSEQPINLPNRRQIFRFLVNNGADTESYNDFAMKPRICLTAT